MRKSTRLATTAFSIVTAIGLMGAQSARAQDVPTNDYYGGRSVASQPTCPTVEWHLLPMPVGVATNVNGIAYYSDMSGISIIRGTVAPSGMVGATLVSVSGNGPAGAVTGTHTAGATKVVLTGNGCANATLDLQRWRPSGGGD